MGRTTREGSCCRGGRSESPLCDLRETARPRGPPVRRVPAQRPLPVRRGVVVSAVLLGNEPHDTPEWHALRAGGIGGSEIAAVVGLSKWTSAFELWHRKRGAIGQQAQNEAMEWGSRLEPVIAAKFAEEHPE